MTQEELADIGHKVLKVLEENALGNSEATSILLACTISIFKAREFTHKQIRSVINNYVKEALANSKKRS